MVQVFNNKNYLQHSTFDLTYLLRIRKKGWKQRKTNFSKKKQLEAATKVKMSKCYSFSISGASKIQIFFLWLNHNGH